MHMYSTPRGKCYCSEVVSIIFHLRIHCIRYSYTILWEGYTQMMTYSNSVDYLLCTVHVDNIAQIIWLWNTGKCTVYQLNDWTMFSLITGCHFTGIFSHSLFAQLLINLLITFLVPLSVTIWWLAEKSQWSGPLLNARWDEASLSLSNCILSRAKQWHTVQGKVR